MGVNRYISNQRDRGDRMCFVYLFVCLFFCLFMNQVHPVELPRVQTGCLRLRGGSRPESLPPAVPGDGAAGHPQTGTLHLRRMGHGEEFISRPLVEALGNSL